jgi:predicted NUDIX family NTP pyrophosphohydrolase
MKNKFSSGLFVYRRVNDESLQVFLVHPGGPFWRSKDDGSWSIPKGELDGDEDQLAVARREFEEEVGQPAPDGELIDLGEIRQPNGKTVRAWAVRGDVKEKEVRSNTFEIEWPPRSGRVQSFPEVDRGGWFSIEVARRKLGRGQDRFVERLLAALGEEDSV